VIAPDLRGFGQSSTPEDGYTKAAMAQDIHALVKSLNPAKSLSEADREYYAREYARPGQMKAGMEVFRAFPSDAEDFAGFAKAKLPMPLLVLSGEKAGGPFLIEQGRMVADNVEGVLVKGSGHWLMEEAPDQVIPKLVEFLNRQALVTVAVRQKPFGGHLHNECSDE
jgi:pimeloyl-ACP methyl ester carboxylesterase